MSWWTDPAYIARQMDPDEEAEWMEHDRRCGHTNDPWLPRSPRGGWDWLSTDVSPAPRIGASPSASGLLLSPPRSPDAPSPRKEAA